MYSQSAAARLDGTFNLRLGLWYTLSQLQLRLDDTFKLEIRFVMYPSQLLAMQVGRYL